MLQLRISSKLADRCSCVNSVSARARAVSTHKPALLIRQRHLRQFKSKLLTAASPSDDVLVSKEEQSDGSILFVFGSEAEASKAGPTAGAAPPVSQEDGPAAASPASNSPREEPPAAAQQQREEAPEASARASDNSSLAADDATGSATAAAASATSREALQSKTVAELKELCRTYDLRGYTAMRKAELVDFVLENLGAPSS